MTRKIVVLGIMASLAFSLLSIQPTWAKLTIVKELDISRYMGKWHELARFPVFYQRGCKASTATYQDIGDGKYSIVNTCFNGKNTTKIEGVATVPSTGKFKTAFKNFVTVRAEYWVLWVDPQYRAAVIATPNGKRAWILARQKKPPQALIDKAVSTLRANGFDPSELIWNTH